jgi:hypothetical protein
MRNSYLVLAGLVVFGFPAAMFAQEPAHRLNLVIVEGDGAINNIRQRTAREPIVQVEDENHKPVAGAAVLFLLPDRGPGGTFADGSHSLSVVTDSQGRAAARGIHFNHAQGQFTIQVTATFGGLTATAVITQSIGTGSGTTTTAASGISTKLIVILAVAAAAVAGGVLYATHHGGGSSPAAAAGTTIAAGGGTVGAPH